MEIAPKFYMKYVLASASPRRKELLGELIKNFIIHPSNAEERVDKNLTPEQTAQKLAQLKCEQVFSLYPNYAVIGCDTVVVYEGRILGKPKSKADAIATLKLLSGRKHEVITGVCIRTSEKELTDYAVTEVEFNDLTDGFILDYVEGGSPMDKAGSYGIQDSGVVKDYVGSYTNVVGLPLELLKNMLSQI